MAQSICFGGLGRNGGMSQLGQSRRFGRGPPLPVYPGGLNRSAQHFILEGKDGV